MDERDIAALMLDPGRGSYDPNQLVVDVREFLRGRGLSADATGHLGMATAGAGMMLRAFGILPFGGPETIDRLNAPDPDLR